MLLEPGAKVQWKPVCFMGRESSIPQTSEPLSILKRDFFFFLDASHAWVNARDEIILCGEVFGTVGSVRERVMSRSQTPRNDGPQAASAFNGITAHLLDRISSGCRSHSCVER